MRLYSLTNPYMHGEDLKALQKALKAAKLYAGEVDGIFGPGTANACKNAKWRLGYPDHGVVPTGGQMLLDYLQGKRELPAAFKVRRDQRGYAGNDLQVIRDQVVAHALWGVQHNSRIAYDQRRPMEHLHSVRELPWVTDCSEFVTTIFCWAKAADPNQLGFNGQGYTGTMLLHGDNIPLSLAIPSDVVIWGYYPGHHTAVVVDVANKNNPDLVSMGSSSDPRRISLQDETNAQEGRPYFIKRYIL